MDKKDRLAYRPRYPGGNEALKNYIKKHLKYPRQAVKNGIEGYVKIRYRINHKGEVFFAEVMSGIGYGCNEEALRLVRSLKYEVPKHYKVKGNYNKVINIKFALPKRTDTIISYNYKQDTGIEVYSYKVDIGN